MWRPLLAAAVLATAAGGPAPWPPRETTPARQTVHYLAVRRWGTAGFGFSVHTATATITSVAPMTPAAEAGLRTGDRILGVPGTTADWIKVLTGNYRTHLAVAREPPLDGTWVSSKGRFSISSTSAGLRARFTDRSIAPHTRNFVASSYPGARCSVSGDSGLLPPLGFTAVDGAWCGEYATWLRHVDAGVEVCLGTGAPDSDDISHLDWRGWGGTTPPPAPPTCRQRFFAYRAGQKTQPLAGADGAVDLARNMELLRDMGMVLLYVYSGAKWGTIGETALFANIAKTVKLRQPKVTFAKVDGADAGAARLLRDHGVTGLPVLFFSRWGGTVMYDGDGDIDEIMEWLMRMVIGRIARTSDPPPAHPLLLRYDSPTSPATAAAATATAPGDDTTSDSAAAVIPKGEWYSPAWGDDSADGGGADAAADSLDLKVHVAHTPHATPRTAIRGVYLIAEYEGIADPRARDALRAHFKYVADGVPWAHCFLVPATRAAAVQRDAPQADGTPRVTANRPFVNVSDAPPGAASLSLVRLGAVEAVRVWYRGSLTDVGRMRRFIHSQRHPRILGIRVLNEPPPQLILYADGSDLTASRYFRALSLLAAGSLGEMAYGIADASSQYGRLVADTKGVPRSRLDTEVLLLWDEEARGGYQMYADRESTTRLTLPELHGFLDSWENGTLVPARQTSYHKVDGEGFGEVVVGLTHDQVVASINLTLLVYLPSSSMLNTHRALRTRLEAAAARRAPDTPLTVRFMLTNVNEGAPGAPGMLDALTVVSGRKAEADGTFLRVANTTVNGYPMWEGAGRTGQVMYTDSLGRWVVGSPADMAHELCWVCSEFAHGGLPPQEVASWVFYDSTAPAGQSWRKSSALKVVDGTPMLYLWRAGEVLASTPAPQLTRKPSIRGRACSQPFFTDSATSRAVDALLHTAGVV